MVAPFLSSPDGTVEDFCAFVAVLQCVVPLR